MTRHDQLPKALHAVHDAFMGLREVQHAPTVPQAAGDAFDRLTVSVQCLTRLAEQLQARAERFANIGTSERAEREGKSATPDQIDAAHELYTATSQLASTTKHLQRALRAVTAGFYELDAASRHAQVEI